MKWLPDSGLYQVYHIRREEEAGHPAGQWGSATEAQRPDPAWWHNTECHRAVPRHRSAAQTGSPGLVSICIFSVILAFYTIQEHYGNNKPVLPSVPLSWNDHSSDDSAVNGDIWVFSKYDSLLCMQPVLKPQDDYVSESELSYNGYTVLADCWIISEGNGGGERCVFPLPHFCWSKS